MKPLLLTIVLFISSLSVSYSQDFNKGEEAYNRGDYTEALQQFEQLAFKGHAEAESYLGDMYYYGRGVTQDYVTAANWYRLAAEQGNAYAQGNLGYVYKNGEGVTQDYKTAVKWYRLAAEQGNAKAQNNLGILLAIGEGVLKDKPKALMWLILSKSNGYDTSETIEIVSKNMTSRDISKAQKMAQECEQKNYEGC